MARISLPNSTLVPSRRTTSGTLSEISFAAGDDAFGDDVALHDAAEDVDEDALHIGVAHDDLEGLRHLLLGGAAADIEEVGGLAAEQLDDVHGRHGQARAIDHAADFAIELDVGEVVFAGFDFRRIFLVQVGSSCTSLWR